MNEDEVTAEVAAGLVAAQFPRWAGLPVTPVAVGGQDNTMFRLGDELCLRLPTASCVAQVGKEHRWLPVLARHLPLPIPEPVALGHPGAGFPRPWSVYRWIAGSPASTSRVTRPSSPSTWRLIRLGADDIDAAAAVRVWDTALASGRAAGLTAQGAQKGQKG